MSPSAVQTWLTRRRAILLSAALAAALSGPLAAAAAEPEDAAGLWEGRGIFERAELEGDFAVELAPTPDGPWTGTVDIPNRDLRYHPLDAVRVQEGPSGVTVEFEYSRFASEIDRRIHYLFRGTLAPGGRRVEGAIDRDGREPVPFVMEKLGPPGTPRPDRPEMEVHDLAPGAGELRARFHRDAGKTRLVMLLSPT